MERISGKTRKITLCAVFVASALVLSLLERWIPSFVPVPGFRLGLSNVAVMLALYAIGPGGGLWVLAGKCILSAVFAGNITAALYSLAGGVLAYAVMLGTMRIRGLSPVGVSVLGAAAHVIGQIAASMVLMGTMVTAAYLPVLLVCAAVTGTVTGLISAWLMSALKGIYGK